MWTCLSVGQLIISEPAFSESGREDGGPGGNKRNPVRHKIFSKQNIGSDLVVTVFAGWKLVKSSMLQGIGLRKVGVSGRHYGLMCGLSRLSMQAIGRCVPEWHI